MITEEEIPRIQYTGPYNIGDTAPFPYSYTDKSQVLALKNSTPLVLDIDYSVSLAKTVTLLIPFLATDTLTLYRKTKLDNQAKFPQDAKFNSEKMNDCLDRITMQQQEQAESIGRSVKLALDAPTSIQNLTIPVPAANKGIKWNATGTGLINSDFDPDTAIDLTKAEADRAELAATNITLANELVEAAVGHMPSTPIANAYYKRTADNTGFEYQTLAQLFTALKDSGALVAENIDAIVNLPVIPLGDITGTNVTTNLVTRTGKVLSFPATSGQYADLDLPFNNVAAQTWEQIWCVTPSQVGVLQCLESNSVNAWSPRIYITAANKIALYLSSNNSSWDIANATIGSYTVANAAQLYIKLERTTTQYILSTSLNGVDYTPDQTITTALTIASTVLSGAVRLGADILANPFKGTIDLSKSSVKIAGGPNLINFAASPTFVKDRVYNAFFKGSVLDTVLPTASETVLRNIMLDFNIQPGRTFNAPPNAKWDYNIAPTFVAWPDLLMNLATINDMKLSFPATSGQYVDLTNVPFNNLGSQPWERIWCITPAQIGVLQQLVGNGLLNFSAPLLGISASNHFVWYLSSNNTSFNICNGTTGTYTVANNTNMYVKEAFTGSQYQLSTSLDASAGSWAIDITINSTTPIYSSSSALTRLGADIATPTANLFKGALDLSKSSVKVNGGRNLLTPDPNVFLNRIIWDTMSGGLKYKAHYSPAGV